MPERSRKLEVSHLPSLHRFLEREHSSAASTTSEEQQKDFEDDSDSNTESTAPYMPPRTRNHTPFGPSSCDPLLKNDIATLFMLEQQIWKREIERRPRNFITLLKDGWSWIWTRCGCCCGGYEDIEEFDYCDG